MDPNPDPSPALLDALWRVVAEEGWRGTTFARIAAESSESLSDLRARYATPVDLLRAHARAVDRAVLAGTVPGQESFGSPRDRVFDLLMRRFDVLAPHRAGVLRLQRDLSRDPLGALLLSPILMASMAWTLEGAGIGTGGLTGALRVQGLTGVWLAAARAWQADESADLGQTMAALDRALDRAEQVARTLRLDREPPPRPAPDPSATSASDDAPEVAEPPAPAATGPTGGPSAPPDGPVPGVPPTP